VRRVVLAAVFLVGGCSWLIPIDDVQLEAVDAGDTSDADADDTTPPKDAGAFQDSAVNDAGSEASDAAASADADGAGPCGAHCGPAECCCVDSGAPRSTTSSNAGHRGPHINRAGVFAGR
jgi:hypothetical protein